MIKKIILVFLALFLFLPKTVSFAQEEILEGRVVEIKKQQLRVLISKGSFKGKEVLVETGDIEIVSQPQYRVGDELILAYDKDLEGNDVFFITDFVRRDFLLFLFLFFVFVVGVVAGKRGLFSLLGMALSFLVIFVFILPRLSQGASPVETAITGSFLIIPISFFLSHGFNKKTAAAIAGTLFALVITSFLADLFIDLSHLTGFASEEAAFLQVAKGEINMKGLLLAGIIIGALGVLDDITVSQAAVVFQLRETDPKLRQKELYQRAMEVGKDHIASMVNTLVLVYTGAALPLLLLFIDSSRSFAEVINYEIIADEIVRTLVGSIGLILAVPITTLIASLLK